MQDSGSNGFMLHMGHHLYMKKPTQIVLNSAKASNTTSNHLQ